MQLTAIVAGKRFIWMKRHLHNAGKKLLLVGVVMLQVC
jgi:hypothetical protein